MLVTGCNSNSNRIVVVLVVFVVVAIWVTGSISNRIAGIVVVLASSISNR